MEHFWIEGGHPLNGAIRPAGNKNAALPLLAACLLTARILPATKEEPPKRQNIRNLTLTSKLFMLSIKCQTRH